ncbi:MAG: alpha/beta hydrolase [Acidimicrobiia bacterium]|nr:alpha/beta hydrolase [Acidimicrobiia bacterium]
MTDQPNEATPLASPPPPERKTLTSSSGFDLIGDLYRAESDAWIIMLHGGGQTRHAWGGTAIALRNDGWNVFAYDQRGHGDSDWSPSGDYGMLAFSDDLMAVGEQLGASAPVTVGASLGGIATMVAAHRHPDLLAGAVLVDIAPRMEPTGLARIIGFMTAYPDGFDSLQDAADVIAGYTGRQRSSNVDGLAKVLRQRDGRWVWHWDPRFISGHGAVVDDRETAIEQAGKFNESLIEAARALTCPTLLVRGQQSDLLSEQGARELLDLLPHAEYVDVTHAGHMVAGDRNDVFTDAVRSFVNTLAPAPAPAPRSRTTHDPARERSADPAGNAR